MIVGKELGGGERFEVQRFGAEGIGHGLLSFWGSEGRIKERGGIAGGGDKLGWE